MRAMTSVKGRAAFISAGTRFAKVVRMQLVDCSIILEYMLKGNRVSLSVTYTMTNWELISVVRTCV